MESPLSRVAAGAPPAQHRASGATLLFFWACALGASGCLAADPEQTVHLLLARPARTAGVALRIDGWRGQPILPVGATTDERIFIETPDHRRPLSIAERGGSIAIVDDLIGHVSWLQLGREIATDRLRIEAEASPARELADMLGAELSRIEPTLWQLRTDGIWSRCSHLPLRDPPRAVSPVRLHPAGDGTQQQQTRTGGVDAPPPGDALPLVSAAQEAATAHVGIYRSSAKLSLWLDASGTFRMISRGVGLRGRYAATRSGVRLSPQGGGPIVLSRDDSGAGLLMPDGQRLENLAAAGGCEISARAGSRDASRLGGAAREANR